MASEGLGHLPSVSEVLDKLKSNGTFDYFRQTCLESIKAEVGALNRVQVVTFATCMPQPSFRAYGEHIEVVSRRYLQNYKWRDSTTKNQVRSRLKDHALSVIERYVRVIERCIECDQEVCTCDREVR